MMLKINVFKAKRNFHTVLNFVLFSIVWIYEIEYRAKICDFIVWIIDNQFSSNLWSVHNLSHIWINNTMPDLCSLSRLFSMNKLSAVEVGITLHKVLEWSENTDSFV